VAVVDAYDDPNAESDVNFYRSKYEIPACTVASGCFRKVNQAGGASYPAPNRGWAKEISLDLDMVSAICPRCHILLVEAKTNEATDLAAAENEAASLGATEISDSFAEATKMEPASAFDHPGIPIAAAAGDSKYGVAWPAANPHVIAVGGTSLSRSGGGWTESVWSDTGSGCSPEPKPAWQSDTGCAGRTNNDVAAVADTNTPVSAYDTYETGSSPWLLVGGTSVSTPIVASAMALASPYTRSFDGAQGLYLQAASGVGGFFDVVSGSNGFCGSYLCEARPGYDGPSGLGALRGIPEVPPPTPATGAAGSITQTGATLGGTVNPHGGRVDECVFEYGPTTSYGASVPCSSLPRSATVPVSVSASITGLLAGSGYHFRLAVSYSGSSAVGADSTFTTLAAGGSLPINIVPPALTGSPAVGEQLTCSTGTWSGTPSPTYSYHWLLENVDIPGANSSQYVVPSADGGLSLACEVTGKNVEGSSSASSVLLHVAGIRPEVEVPPSVTGIAGVGRTLTCQTGIWKGEPPPTFAFQWLRDGTPVAAATGSTYAVEPADEGHRLTCDVTASNSEGSTEAESSNGIAVTPPQPTVATGLSSSLGQASAVLNGTVNPNGVNVAACKFEYGTSTAYGASAPCSPAPGSGTTPVAVSAALAGLTANTGYHFRIVATGEGGTSDGADASFRTLPDAPTVLTGAAASVSQSSATLDATVNPNGGEVTECTVEYGATSSYGATVPCAAPPGAGTAAVPVTAAVIELSADTAYHYRIVAGNAGGSSFGEDKTFRTLTNPPTVTTGGYSSTPKAVLNAAVNPNGGEVTDCHFEYGNTTMYGITAPCITLPGFGWTVVEVSAAVTGLTVGGSYHFRIVAANAGGTSYGEDQTFTARAPQGEEPRPPTVDTTRASAVDQSAATLNATVDPNGSTVSDCHFDYGTTTTYGSSVTCSPLPGSGSSSVPASATAIGLAADTSYYYRIVATNPAGTTYGAAQAFTTQLPTTPTQQGPTGQQPPRPQEHNTAATPDAVLASASLTANTSGILRVKVGCPAGENNCIGTITLRTLSAVTTSAGSHRPKKPKAAILTLATASFSVPSGQSKLITLHLSKKSRALLTRLHVLRARATIVARDPEGATHTTQTTVTIHPAKTTHKSVLKRAIA
jgi:phosphodiesterase/alkaline phosphatase D-like protein